MCVRHPFLYLYPLSFKEHLSFLRGQNSDTVKSYDMNLSFLNIRNSDISFLAVHDGGWSPVRDSDTDSGMCIVIL